MKKPVESLQIGDVLFDMHEAYRLSGDMPNALRIKEPHHVAQRIQVTTNGGGALLEKAMYCAGDELLYVNKCLVVLDVIRKSPSLVHVKAGWSYDDSTFGLMLIEVTAE